MKEHRRELPKPDWCDFKCAWAILKKKEPDDYLHPPKCYRFCPKWQAEIQI